MSLKDDLAKSMQATIERNMDADMKELFGSMTTFPSVPAAGANLSVEDLMKTAELFSADNPRLSYLRDPEAGRKEDIEKNRGHLIINPEFSDTASMEGDIAEKDGKEYRIVLDENLRGMRNKDGTTPFGYWLDPLPPIKLPPIQMSEKDQKRMFRDWSGAYNANRYFQSMNLFTSPSGFGLGLIDDGPAPNDIPEEFRGPTTLRGQTHSHHKPQSTPLPAAKQSPLFGPRSSNIS